MSGELALQFSEQLNKSGVLRSSNFTKSIDVTNRPVSQDVVAATPAGITLDLGQVSTIGHVTVRHLSENTGAAYLYVGESGNWQNKLKPGEWTEGRWNFTTVHVKTDAGTAYVDYAIKSA